MNRMRALSSVPAVEVFSARSEDVPQENTRKVGVAASHAPDRRGSVPCGDRCKGCGAPLDDYAVLSIGAAILDLGDMCTPCQRDEIREFAGVDR